MCIVHWFIPLAAGMGTTVGYVVRCSESHIAAPRKETPTPQLVRDSMRRDVEEGLTAVGLNRGKDYVLLNNGRIMGIVLVAFQILASRFIFTASTLRYR